MASKRKRKRPNHSIKDHSKRQKLPSSLKEDPGTKDSVIKQALLPQFYLQVFSLREYLLSKLQSTSKISRKEILSVVSTKTSEHQHEDEELSSFLDQTLVGELVRNDSSQEDRWRQWTTFSPKSDESITTLVNLNGVGGYSQSEIVNFAIWLLFSKSYASNGRVQHLLCQGFRKEVSSRMVNRDENPTSAIPGVVSTYPNNHVSTMKSSPWSKILLLMGREGEKVMIDLILDCGVFVEVGSGRGVYHQLSGIPLSDLPVLPVKAENRFLNSIASKNDVGENKAKHSLSSITFVRSRMLYSRAALNAQGGVRFGLRHIHVLSRCLLKAAQSSSPSDGGEPSLAQKLSLSEDSTVHIMMYVFPKQFGLHNVFTGEVDPRQTVQPYKDYTIREEEISRKFPPPTKPKIPKRLRGRASNLIRKLQVYHSRCSYKNLLEYHCPVNCGAPVFPVPKCQNVEEREHPEIFKPQNTISAPGWTMSTIGTKEMIPQKPASMMDYATPTAMVSAFCRAVLAKLIPNEFWGTGSIQVHNKSVFMGNVDKFIELRRFENLSLHEVSQGLQISSIEWLQLPNCANNKLSQSDKEARLEIFHEFVYYTFDSILIPLIRSNFHVTESNIHRYRLFYFRHDVWRSLAEPAIAKLKLTMLQEVKLEQAQKLLGSRQLGFSQVRLLPKETGVRPIMNLRRRSLKKGSKNMLGSSINSVLAPVYNAFTFEKATNPNRLGSTLFSVGDLYTKLKVFKNQLQNSSAPLYFAKVDVQSAFDTIPQAAVIKLMSSIPTEAEYRISKHAEIRPADNYHADISGQAKAKPMRKWTALAKSADDFENFKESLETNLAVGKKNTIFVDNVVSQFRDTEELIDLLTEHVQRNMVKIGKKFYRQKEGIPQGSVLSSLLCNYFYADLETQHLSFLQPQESLLLRLIDDFLLITINRDHAKAFIQIMHDGLPAYGVNVNPTKTLVNFEVTINERKVLRQIGTRAFPYCGCFIDTKTLDISSDRERRKDLAMTDSLTVEFSKVPGKTFHRKVLNTFKIQSHAMFLDTSFNSLATVLGNIYEAFKETALKMWLYSRCLEKRQGRSRGLKGGLVRKTISDLIDLAFVLMKSKGRNTKKRDENNGFKCKVTKVQVEWLALTAFQAVLQKRQCRYKDVLEWIEVRILVLKEREKGVSGRLVGR